MRSAVRGLGARPGALLVVLVAASAGLRYWAASRIPSPWITPDEQTYAELGRAGEVRPQLVAPRRLRDLRLEAERLRRRTHLLGPEPPRSEGVERQFLERETPRRPDEVGPLRSERVVGGRIEGHGYSLVRVLT